MSWWDGTDAFESLHGKTQSTGTVGMRCHQSHLWTVSSYLAHWLTTLWGLANIPPPMLKATDMSRLRLSLSFSCFFFLFVSRIDMMEEAGTWNWSQGSNSIVFRRPRKLHFLHISKEFPHLPAAKSHGSSYRLQWQWKDGVCCCVNHGNDPLTLCVCVHHWLYCPIWMFTV